MADSSTQRPQRRCLYRFRPNIASKAPFGERIPVLRLSVYLAVKLI